MASYTPGVELSSDGTSELGATLVGPIRVFHDLGAENGDLIRSGNATCARFVFAPLFLGSQGAPTTSQAIPLARSDYHYFEGFAATLNSVGVRFTSNSGSVSNTVVGVGTKDASLPFGGGSGGQESYYSVSNLGGATYGNWGSRRYPFWYGLYFCQQTQTSLSAGASSTFMIHAHELSVTGANTLRVAVSTYTFTGTVAALKAEVDRQARSVIDYNHSATITTTTITAKQYLASFPYFLIQWPCATFPINLIHARGFVS